MSAGISLIRRQPVPLHGLGFVLRHTATFIIHPAKIALSQSISLIRRQPVPLHGFSFVCLNPKTLRKNPTDKELCLSVPLLCRIAVPLAKKGLCVGVSPLSRCSEPCYGLGFVFRHAQPISIHIAYPVLRAGMPLFRRFPVPLRSLSEVFWGS